MTYTDGCNVGINVVRAVIANFKYICSINGHTKGGYVRNPGLAVLRPQGCRWTMMKDIVY